jgi:hypothetical protein
MSAAMWSFKTNMSKYQRVGVLFCTLPVILYVLTFAMEACLGPKVRVYIVFERGNIISYNINIFSRLYGQGKRLILISYNLSHFAIVKHHITVYLWSHIKISQE